MVKNMSAKGCEQYLTDWGKQFAVHQTKDNPKMSDLKVVTELENLGVQCMVTGKFSCLSLSSRNRLSPLYWRCHGSNDTLKLNINDSAEKWASRIIMFFSKIMIWNKLLYLLPCGFSTTLQNDYIHLSNLLTNFTENRCNLVRENIIKDAF